MRQSLDPEANVTVTGLTVLSTATGLSVLSAEMIDGCSRFKVGSILASVMQIFIRSTILCRNPRD